MDIFGIIFVAIIIFMICSICGCCNRDNGTVYGPSDANNGGTTTVIQPHPNPTYPNSNVPYPMQQPMPGMMYQQQQQPQQPYSIPYGQQPQTFNNGSTSYYPFNVPNNPYVMMPAPPSQSGQQPMGMPMPMPMPMPMQMPGVHQSNQFVSPPPYNDVIHNSSESYPKQAPFNPNFQS